MKRLLVTGSSGLIGSEVCAYFAATRLGRPRRRQQPARGLLRPAGRHALEPAAARARRFPDFIHHELDIRDRAGVLALVAATPARRHRPHRRAALARPGRGDPVRRLRHQRRRHAEPARGGARSHCPESPFVHMSTNKVYGDAPEHASPLAELADALGLRRPGLRRRHPRDVLDRPVHALAVRRVARSPPT